MSTCDRVEVLAATDNPAAADGVLGVLAGRAGLSAAMLDGQCFRAQGREALAHLFAIAASLESQVIGEPQVLGQLKESHRAAAAEGMTTRLLEAALQAAYGAAKRVRNETAIAQRPVSIAAVAAQLARRVHGELSRSSALLLGLGEMGELLAGELCSAGVGHLMVIHASQPRAEAAAHRLGCNYRPWEELADALAEADTVVAASGTGRYVVTATLAAVALKKRRQRPIFFIDAAVPGDVEPAVGALDGAFVYDLGDLEGIVLEGRAGREATGDAARRILDEELSAFLRDQAERDAVPAVVTLRRRFEATRDSVLTESGLDAAEATRRLINRLLHGPSEALRRAATDEAADRETLERAVESLFVDSGRGEVDDEDDEEEKA
jgi:glutamyl-tRNA reductase